VARVNITYPGYSVFKDQIVIRVTDLGLAGHLSFDGLVSILNDVSARFFASHGIKRGRTGPVGVLHTDLVVNYLSEAFYGDAVLIEVAIDDVKKKGFDLFFRVTSRSGGKEIALAKIGVLFYNYAEKKAVFIPDELHILTGKTAC
jgi:acyl-CoA thioester hydrolase